MSCRDRSDTATLIKLVSVLFVILAAGMVVEVTTRHNPFAMLGGVPDVPVVRGGKARAQGPFDVSILAGTVAAGFLPLFVGLWRQASLAASVGIVAALVAVVASTSSGPILTAAAAFAALAAWPLRLHLWLFRWGMVAAYLVLAVVMNDPPYYLMAKIDLTGSSTGWHRAAIIDAAIVYWDEWWLTGTDRTIHWMPYGIPWSADHTDITNQYLQMGVLGGVGLMALFIGTLAVAFLYIGRELRRPERTSADHWIAWGVGASLVSHAVTFMSIAYYDQSMAFFYFDLAIAGGLAAAKSARPGGRLALTRRSRREQSLPPMTNDTPPAVASIILPRPFGRVVAGRRLRRDAASVRVR